MESELRTSRQRNIFIYIVMGAIFRQHVVIITNAKKPLKAAFC